MLITQTSIWQNYLSHILSFEGKTSKDPRDSASKCAPFAGAYHTNKGITFCTFKNFAAQCNIKPVTYDRFLKLSDSDVSQFLYYIYYKDLQGRYIKDPIAFSLIEIAYGSGQTTAARTLQKALNSIGIKARLTGRIDQETINLMRRAGIKTLFNAIWNIRVDYLKTLSVWETYKNGWTNRINNFISKFQP
jgi:lysozyme family protein